MQIVYKSKKLGISLITISILSFLLLVSHYAIVLGDVILTQKAIKQGSIVTPDDDFMHRLDNLTTPLYPTGKLWLTAEPQLLAVAITLHRIENIIILLVMIISLYFSIKLRKWHYDYIINKLIELESK